MMVNKPNLDFAQDKALVLQPKFEEFWHRDVEESIRQRNVKPFIEEAVLQVSNWGFSLTDLQVQKKCSRKGILPWLKSMYSQAECELTGFLRPIHIWQVCIFFLLVCVILVYLLQYFFFMGNNSNLLCYKLASTFYFSSLE